MPSVVPVEIAARRHYNAKDEPNQKRKRVAPQERPRAAHPRVADPAPHTDLRVHLIARTEVRYAGGRLVDCLLHHVSGRSTRCAKVNLIDLAHCDVLLGGCASRRARTTARCPCNAAGSPRKGCSRQARYASPHTARTADTPPERPERSGRHTDRRAERIETGGLEDARSLIEAKSATESEDAAC